MTKQKAARNKTIDTTAAEGAQYLERCIQVDSMQPDIDGILDKTIFGDTFAVLPLLPKGSVDLLVVDPPYNLSKQFGDTPFNRMDEAAYEQYTRDWMKLAAPLVKENGSVYVCCDWESSLVIGRVLGEFFTVRNRITWQREKGRGAKRNWKNGMEDIWFATNGEGYTFNLEQVKLRRKVLAPYRQDGAPKDWKESGGVRYRDTCPSNFWDDITIPFWSMAENTAHPTQKSEKLLAKIILASSNPGDVVLDPFVGSGTTSVTAKKLGRRYIGIECEAQYCVWTEQRLERAEKNKRIQGYQNGIFWARHEGR